MRYTTVTGPALLAGAFLLPKALLLAFARERLWIDLGLGDTLRALAPDALAALACSLIVCSAARRSRGAGLAASCAALAVLAVLLLDTRVRQLWLRPLDLETIGYALRWSDDLASGSEMFFKGQAGLGFTFRRAAALAWAVGAAGAALVLAGGAWELSPRLRRAEAPRSSVVAGLLALLAVVATGPWPALPYRLEVSPLSRPFADLVREAVVRSPEGARAEAFEQRPRPLDAVLAEAPRRRLEGAKPFRNAVVITFESCRYDGLDLEGEGPTPVPGLRRLAREGLLARCRASVPHSSKALYSIVTGLYPFPGLEMRETIHPPEAPFLRALAAERGARAHVFSVESLTFEGLGAMYRGCGIANQVGPEELVRRAGGRGEAHSSFAEDDALLVGPPAEDLAREQAPFWALLMTGSSHHPYTYPGKADPADDSFASYRRALEYSDAKIAETLVALDRRGLLEETLVVIVGDHGEAFGEHGTFTHNNGLYEEEVAVPLVFWSKDGRMRCDEVLEARQVDIVPTAADLLGLSGRGARVQGVSLLRGRAPAAFLASFFDGVALGLVEGTTKWILEPASGRLARFDLSADPGERSGTDVPSSTPEGEAIRRRLSAFRAAQDALHGGAPVTATPSPEGASDSRP